MGRRLWVRFPPSSGSRRVPRAGPSGRNREARSLAAGRGFDVVAVEPQAPLRERLAATIGAERVREGLAEAIPLPDASVDAVTVADGFHWFSQERALSEFRRVLAPGGGLAVLSTFPDWSGASWGNELGARIMRLRPEHPYFDGPPWQEAVRAAARMERPARDSCDHLSADRPEADRRPHRID